MPKDMRVQRNITITAEVSEAIAAWADMEQCSEEQIMTWIIERGYAAVNYELNQRWINRDIRSRFFAQNPDLRQDEKSNQAIKQAKQSPSVGKRATRKP